MDKKELINVSNSPGVYLWKDKFSNILYIGKAKDLRKRMNQYFTNMHNSYKTSNLVSKIDSFEVILTNNEQEALILERNLIEKYSPEFNILLTDDKRYPYFKISLTNKGIDISLVYRIKTKDNSNSLYFGPFPPGTGAREFLKLLQRIFLYENGIPIINKPKEFWNEKFKYIRKLFASGISKLIIDLRKEMINAANNLQFEIANNIKSSIESIEFFKDKQVAEFKDGEDIDVIAFFQKDEFISISMVFYRSGVLLSKRDFLISITNSKQETIEQFINQYYGFNYKPSQIITNESLGIDMNFINPQKGIKKKILKLAILNSKDNIEFKLEQFKRKQSMTIGAMNKLSKILNLKTINHILMIDNSNTNNTEPVSVIISYRNGIKQPKEYRKYVLKIQDRKSDVDYIKQGVEKYFEKETNPIPDLFIVDGGIQQVNEANKILKNVNVIGLVKNEKHQTKSIINLEGKEIFINDNELLNFLSSMQIEVDKYAKSFHRRKRSIKTLEGKLSQINGIGFHTEKKLLNHFKTYSAIYNSSLEELKKVVSENIAIKIFKIFNN